jgi:hypothetical protein
MISPSTPGYIAPDRHYVHVPNYDTRPAPDPAPDQEDIIFQGRKTKAKVFTDVRSDRLTTILIDR